MKLVCCGDDGACSVEVGAGVGQSVGVEVEETESRCICIVVDLMSPQGVVIG